MNEQTQNNHPLEEQPEGTAPLPPGERASDVSPTRRFKLTWEFVAGFLGWYLVSGLIYAAGRGQETLIICSGLLFPVNVVFLILFLRKQPQLGWGMLSALGVNLVISLILGLSTSAFCFIPFFSGVK